MIQLKQLLTEALNWNQCKGWNKTGESHWNGTDGKPKIVIDKTTAAFNLTYTGKLSGFYISSATRGAKDSVHQAFNVMACECNDFLNSNAGLKPDIDNIKTSCTYDPKTNYTLQIIIPFVNVGYGKWQINRRGSWGGTPDISTLPVASNYYEFYPTDKKYVTNVTKIPNDSVFGNITEYFVTYNMDTTSAIAHQNTNKSKPTKDKDKDKDNNDASEVDTETLFTDEELPGTEKSAITFAKLKSAKFQPWFLDLETGKDLGTGVIEDQAKFSTKNRIIATGSNKESLKQQILVKAKENFKTDYPRVQLFWRENANSKEKGKFTVICLLDFQRRQLKPITIAKQKILPIIDGNTWADYQAKGWQQFSWDSNKIAPSTIITTLSDTDLYMTVDLQSDKNIDYNLSTEYYTALDKKHWTERDVKKAGGHLIWRKTKNKSELWVVFEDLPEYKKRFDRLKQTTAV